MTDIIAVAQEVAALHPITEECAVECEECEITYTLLVLVEEVQRLRGENDSLRQAVLDYEEKFVHAREALGKSTVFESRIPPKGVVDWNS